MNNLELPTALYRTEQIKVMEQAVIQQGIISGFGGVSILWIRLKFSVKISSF